MARDIRKDPGVLTKPAAAEKPAAKPVNETPGPVNETPEPVNDSPLARRPIEAHLAAAKLSAPLVAALRSMTRWGQGQKLTDAQFAAALDKLRTLPAREV